RSASPSIPRCVFFASSLRNKLSTSPCTVQMRLTVEQKKTIRAHRNLLLQKWAQQLNESPTDWPALFDIHWSEERTSWQIGFSSRVTPYIYMVAGIRLI